MKKSLLKIRARGPEEVIDGVDFLRVILDGVDRLGVVLRGLRGSSWRSSGVVLKGAPEEVLGGLGETTWTLRRRSWAVLMKPEEVLDGSD